MKNTVLASVAIGMMLGAMISFGIVTERLFGWSTSRALITSAIVTCTAIVTLVVTSRPRSSIVLGAQTLGAVTGVLLVHAMLRASAWAALPGLYEHPLQLVNDFVATFGVLAIVWGLAQRPLGSIAIAAGITVVFGYRLTASSWHFDHLAVASAVTIQQFVFAEWVAAAFGLALFRSLVTSAERVE